MFCSKCGANLPDNSTFCTHCGAQLGGGGQPQQNPNAQPQPQPQMSYQQSAPQYQQQVPNYGMQPPKRKKKGCLISALVALGLLVILIIAALLNGGEISFTSANVAEAYMATQINEQTAEPIMKTDVFSTADTVIYVSARLKNVPSDTEVSSVWTYVSSGESLPSNTIIAGSDMWVQFNLQNPEGFIAGDYKVDILIDGKIKKTLPFTVQ